MRMDEHQMLGLLDRYLDGTATPEEQARVETWIKKQGRSDGEWAEMSAREKSRYVERLYDAFIKGREEGDAAPDAGRVVPMRRRRKPLLFTLAAAAAAAAAILIPLWKNHTAHIPAVAMVTESTGVGSIREITLPDSTHVWLNAGGELRYAKGFKGSRREVYLEGEAFFDVASMPGQPFIIHSGELDTRVLGTSFDVAAYGSDPAVRVVVAAGKVQVSLPGNTRTMTLSRDQMVTYRRAGHTLSKSEGVDWRDFASWREGKIVFHHTPLAEVARVLGRHYHLSFTLAGQALGASDITGEFRQDQSAELILQAICLSIGAEYHIKDGHVVIHSRK